MKRILLCPNAGRDKGLALTREVAEMLRGLSLTVVCPISDDGPVPPLPEWLRLSRLEDELENGADMVVAFGGDGTILRAARAAAGKSVPVLGVNMGSKGFIAEIEREDVGLIRKAVEGDYEVDRRMMLDVELVRGGRTIHTDFALNDVVVAGVTKVIDLSLYGDGHLISRFSGDGAVVATPTGSTAYSMAAGGPIVEPCADSIIVTPICAHVLAAKSFVLAPDRLVTIELGHVKANPAYMTVDGGPTVSLSSGDTIRVRRSGKETLLVSLSDRSFYNKVSEKLGDKS